MTQKECIPKSDVPAITRRRQRSSHASFIVFPASVVFPPVAVLPLSSWGPKWRNLCVISQKFHVKITILNETSRFRMTATDYYIPNYDPLSPDANTILLLFHSTRQCELSPLPPFQRKGVIVPLRFLSYSFHTIRMCKNHTTSLRLRKCPPSAFGISPVGAMSYGPITSM